MLLQHQNSKMMCIWILWSNVIFAKKKDMKTRIKQYSTSNRMIDIMPDFISGISSLFSMPSNNLYREYMRGSVAGDMRKDWEAVGGDLRAAIKKCRKEVKNGRRK